MADGKGRGADELKTSFVFVRHGDPLPHEWMARHPGWVKFPATLVPRPVPRRVVPDAAWDAAGAGEPAGFGPASRPVSVGAPVVRRRRVPVHRLPTGEPRDAQDPIAAYLRISKTMGEAASTYLTSVRASAGVGGPVPAGHAAAAPDGHKPASGAEHHGQVPLHRLSTVGAPDTRTLDELSRRLSKKLDQTAALDRMDPLTADQLRAIMPDAGAAADLYVGVLNDAMAAHGIATAAQRAAFLAQIAVESGQLHDTVERLNYTAHGITQSWPGLFPTDADAAPYVHKPEALTNRAYARKNGNGDEQSGDGFRYRGLMRVTGRANYRAVGFEDNPDAMAEPQNAADSAAKWWQNKGLDGRTDALLDRKQFDAVTHTVNRRELDAQKRWEAYQRALDAFGVPSMKRFAAAAAFLAALSATYPGAADGLGDGPRMSESLCRAPETPLFSCRISTKVVSICGRPRSEQAQGERTPGEQAQDRAVYRFGRPGRIELEATGLHYAEQGFAGGGETQVYADTATHRYIVFEEVVRTAFGADGRHDPQADSGLFVQRGGKIVSSRTCTEAMTFSPLAEKLIPLGDYVPH